MGKLRGFSPPLTCRLQGNGKLLVTDWLPLHCCPGNKLLWQLWWQIERGNNARLLVKGYSNNTLKISCSTCLWFYHLLSYLTIRPMLFKFSPFPVLTWTTYAQTKKWVCKSASILAPFDYCTYLNFECVNVLRYLFPQEIIFVRLLNNMWNHKPSAHAFQLNLTHENAVKTNDVDHRHIPTKIAMCSWVTATSSFSLFWNST